MTAPTGFNEFKNSLPRCNMYNKKHFQDAFSLFSPRQNGGKNSCERTLAEDCTILKSKLGSEVEALFFLPDIPSIFIQFHKNISS